MWYHTIATAIDHLYSSDSLYLVQLHGMKLTAASVIQSSITTSSISLRTHQGPVLKLVFKVFFRGGQGALCISLAGTQLTCSRLFRSAERSLEITASRRKSSPGLVLLSISSPVSALRERLLLPHVPQCNRRWGPIVMVVSA
jgi:hypothetical protein